MESSSVGEHPMITIIRLLLGLTILTSGRKLYWLFVGIVGFVLGMTLATLFFASESEFVYLAIALVSGVIGIVLSLLVQRLAVGLAGFIAGGYILTSLLEVLGLVISWPYWILFLIGGLVGVVFVTWLFDWALIVMSSLAGAGLVVQSFALQEWINIFLFIFLFVMGVGFQRSVMKREQTRS
jgi:hypothetical protein